MRQAAGEFITGGDVTTLLTAAARDRPDNVYVRHGDEAVTFGQMESLVSQTVESLLAAGASGGSRIAISLPNSVAHIAAIFATLRLGALWVPLNTRLKGDPLSHILHDSAATHLIATENADIVAAAEQAIRKSGGTLRDAGASDIRMWRFLPEPRTSDPAGDTRVLMYTSGTTGPPKGVRVSDSMLRAAALGSLEVTAIRPGDVFYQWEPLFHIGGAQMPLVPLVSDTSLALSERFSATRFWREVVEYQATHLHYLGGILQILLNLPESRLEREHRIRVAWGAGATPAVWRDCERRFGFTLRECYGMTETSSIVTVNRQGPRHGVGEPLPWFDVELAGDDDAGADAPGEILVRGRLPGLITSGYLGNDEATRAARRGEWFRTGDLGVWNDDGHLHFHGRANDTVRVRGENVSAWQLESVFSRHPDVDMCAVLGVAAEVGEQEIMLFVSPTGGKALDPGDLLTWASERLPVFQLPRYVKITNELPLTPSHRVAKQRLHADPADAFDRDSVRTR